MSKRDTDTEKWERPWFRSLPTKMKLFWLYVLDRCDQIGIWYVDLELASFMIGEHVTKEEALTSLAKQITVLDEARWKINDFVEFQYGELVPTNNFHRSILKKLALSGANQPLTKVRSGTIKKRISKEEGKEEGKGEFKNVFLSDDEQVKLTERLGEDRSKKAIEILSAYKQSSGKKYKSDYAAFHTWVIGELEKREHSNGTHKQTSARPAVTKADAERSLALAKESIARRNSGDSRTA